MEGGRAAEKGRQMPKETYTKKLGTEIGLFGLLLPSIGRWKVQDRAWRGR